MAKFGPVKYAVLCKTNALKPEDIKEEDPEAKTAHKGTGFVKFLTKEPALQLLELSKKVEEQMDEERKNSRLKKAPQASLVSSLSLLKNEIELDGRRLIVKESVTREEAGVIK
jgi:RNA recognition motif-containing protein